ncbi:hypothetical protein A3K63_00815 [Candidatus Micrarchaeota archaeon RBG_16_49_10]|nr:MAG: hypothetical protein A3K63_00815 [Candidatus Micrarchaeota archaeon RBG_16_49_10]
MIHELLRGFDMKGKFFSGGEWLRRRGVYTDNVPIGMELNRKRIEGKVVLDAGCGEGKTAYYFSSFAKRIEGVDVIGEDIEKAKRKYRKNNLNFQVADVCRLPFGDSTFDVVYSHWVVEHLKKPGNFISEAHRVLKKGGVLALWVPNVKSLEGFLIKIIPHSFKVKLIGILQGRRNGHYYRCYYRANSVRKLDKLCGSKFIRVFLRRFDSMGYYNRFKFLTALSLLKNRLISNRFLDWVYSEFYVEYRKI